MKQQLTQSDIDSLPKDLRDKMYSVFNNPFLTIGQAIEYLVNHYSSPMDQVDYFQVKEDERGHYEVTYVVSRWHGGVIVEEHRSNELLTALFEAVKKIL